MAAAPSSSILVKASPMNKKLGKGAYGCVEVLQVNGVHCAGKTFHASLIRVGVDESVKTCYEKLAHCLCALRHPNIVQFLGIYFLDDDADPARQHRAVLVTEELQYNLDSLLESSSSTIFAISLARKCSILQDVARGLTYLHGHAPPLVHLDLTAKNVLLSSAAVAKIGDVGNSLVLEDKEGELVKLMTKEVKMYMPPEVFKNPLHCGPKVDVFSFGHLILYTAIEVFPYIPNPDDYNEVAKREKYFSQMERIIEVPELTTLSKRCLECSPEARPTALEALQVLQTISSKVTDQYHNMNRLQLENVVREQEERLPALIKENEQLEKQIADINKNGGEKRKKASKPKEPINPPQIQLPEALEESSERTKQLEEEKAKLEERVRELEMELLKSSPRNGRKPMDEKKLSDSPRVTVVDKRIFKLKKSKGKKEPALNTPLPERDDKGKQALESSEKQKQKKQKEKKHQKAKKGEESKPLGDSTCEVSI